MGKPGAGHAPLAHRVDTGSPPTSPTTREVEGRSPPDQRIPAFCIRRSSARGPSEDHPGHPGPGQQDGALSSEGDHFGLDVAQDADIEQVFDRSDDGFEHLISMWR